MKRAPETEQSQLAGNDLTAWIALRRVNEGGVTVVDCSYYHRGRAIPHYLTARFADLVGAGLLKPAAVQDATGMRKVSLTEDGRELYAALCGQSQPRNSRM